MRPNLQKRGKNISKVVEIVNMSQFGFWLYALEREFFISFSNFPWFRDATINQIYNVELQGLKHFHWPELDIDLDVDRIEYPERYPLISKI